MCLKCGKQESYQKSQKIKTKPYLWRTSAIDRNKNNFYREEFVTDKRLIKKEQNFDLYRSKPLEICSNKHKNKLVISSMNLQKDTIQVVPVPVKGKNYANMFYFVKNVDLEQQKAVWKKVVVEAEKILKKHKQVFISSQGLGIDYFHVKISTFAKFYENSPLQRNLTKVAKDKMTKEYNKQTKSSNNIRKTKKTRNKVGGKLRLKKKSRKRSYKK